MEIHYPKVAIRISQIREAVAPIKDEIQRRLSAGTGSLRGFIFHYYLNDGDVEVARIIDGVEEYLDHVEGYSYEELMLVHGLWAGEAAALEVDNVSRLQAGLEMASSIRGLLKSADGRLAFRALRQIVISDGQSLGTRQLCTESGKLLGSLWVLLMQKATCFSVPAPIANAHRQRVFLLNALASAERSEFYLSYLPDVFERLLHLLTDPGNSVGVLQVIDLHLTQARMSELIADRVDRAESLESVVGNAPSDVRRSRRTDL